MRLFVITANVSGAGAASLYPCPLKQSKSSVLLMGYDILLLADLLNWYLRISKLPSQ